LHLEKDVYFADILRGRNFRPRRPVEGRLCDDFADVELEGLIEDRVIFRATSLMIASKLSSGATGFGFTGLLCDAPVNDDWNFRLGSAVVGVSLAAV
jgi:hypothetical protein